MPFEDMGMSGAMVLCLAVLPALALPTARVVEALLPHVRPLLPMVLGPCRLLVALALPRARASPLATVVLRC
jgi:hypothetical protein